LAEWGNKPSAFELSRFVYVSIGFAAQDLKSPISNFGHTFLVFHNELPAEADSLVAEFTGNFSSFSDYISSITTSVSGKYSLSYFSQKRMLYDLENRSLWLYRLNLSSNENLNLRNYIEQSLNKNYQYDYTQKNCAFYIANAISEAKNKLPFDKNGKIFVTPVDTLRWARSKNLILSSTFFPSTQILALSQFDELSSNDQEILLGLVRGDQQRMLANSEIDINDSLSLVLEYLLPRESSAVKRNALYSLKKIFPAPAKIKAPQSEDPSILRGSSSVSVMFLPQLSASIIAFNPGFIFFENEATTGQRNATIEALKTNVILNNNGDVKLTEFHLVRIESNQPSGFIKDGFTQALDISYIDYESYLGKKYAEEKILFGRGVSYSFLGHTISALPIASILISQQESGSNIRGQIEVSTKIYKRINPSVAYFAQINNSLFQNSEIHQVVNFELMGSVSDNFSVSLNIYSAIGELKALTLSGMKLSYLF
jgi:hypothetical protein